MTHHRAAARRGIQVVLGTPTYSIPVWMYRERASGNSGDETRAAKGDLRLRQNMDISNPAFRFYSERVIRKICEHYKDNPAVIGYQLDNETGPYGPPVPGAGELRQVPAREVRNGGTAQQDLGAGLLGPEPERVDGTCRRVDGILNPGWKLESKLPAESGHGFPCFQANIVNEYKRPDQFVTQDFAGRRPDVNEDAIAKHLDIAAVNPYHPTQEIYDGVSSSMRAITRAR